MQLGLEKHKELPTVPLVNDFVTKPEDRQVLELIFSRQAMGRPLVAPPGLDPRVAQALRQGFADAMRDPQFIAEGAKMSLELELRQRRDRAGMVERLYESSPEVMARAQAIASAQ